MAVPGLRRNRRVSSAKNRGCAGDRGVDIALSRFKRVAVGNSAGTLIQTETMSTIVVRSVCIDSRDHLEAIDCIRLLWKNNFASVVLKLKNSFKFENSRAAVRTMKSSKVFESQFFERKLYINLKFLFFLTVYLVLPVYHEMWSFLLNGYIRFENDRSSSSWKVGGTNQMMKTWQAPKLFYVFHVA